MNNPILTIFRSKTKILIGLFGLVGVLVFHKSWLRLIGDALVVEDGLQPADVIHVIAGEDDRTDYAIQLYKNGYGKTLFFTGGWCELHLYHHGEHARERAVSQGIPLDAIAFDNSTVTSTYGEAERLREWILHSPHPVRSVIVVSDPFHMRRARWTYQKVFGNQIRVQMAPVPFELYSLSTYLVERPREPKKRARGIYQIYLLSFQVSI